jgi:hypothetical protein
MAPRHKMKIDLIFIVYLIPYNARIMHIRTRSVDAGQLVELQRKRISTVQSELSIKSVKVSLFSSRLL